MTATPATTQLTEYQQKVANVRDLLARHKRSIESALPKHMRADRMLKIALTSCQKTPELLECTPGSLINCIVQAAQLGLEPDGVLGEAYLIPFKDRDSGKKLCTLIPGYKGLLKLARQSGMIASVSARVVREKDEFSYAYGLQEELTHVPSTEEDPGRPVFVYAIVRFKDGGHHIDVMAREEIERVRARSRAGKSGPWVTDFEEMAKKTVLRRALKMCPASVELHTAVAMDEHVDAGLQPADVIDVTAESEEPQVAADGPPKTLDDVTRARKRVAEPAREPGAEG